MRRTRCTCRRTSSRASAPGTSRPRPTPLARHAAKGKDIDEALPRHATTWCTRTCSSRATPTRAGSSRRRRRSPSAAPAASSAPYALAAMPARYAVERGDWSEAAQLEPRDEQVPLHRGDDAISRARSAPRARRCRRRPSKDVARARRAARRAQDGEERVLGAARSRCSGSRPRRGSRSPQGKTDEALGLMRAAADLEDQQREAHRHAGPHPARARAARRHAAGAEAARPRR